MFIIKTEGNAAGGCDQHEPQLISTWIKSTEFDNLVSAIVGNIEPPGG